METIACKNGFVTVMGDKIVWNGQTYLLAFSDRMVLPSGQLMWVSSRAEAIGYVVAQAGGRIGPG